MGQVNPGYLYEVLRTRDVTLHSLDDMISEIRLRNLTGLTKKLYVPESPLGGKVI